MELAENSVPKINAPAGEGYGSEGGLVFCPLKEGARAFQKRHAAAKLLFLTDGASYFSVSCLEKSPRVLSLVLDSRDALPLFSMPDGVASVIAAGGADTLRAARFFAEVRNVPCALFPASLSLDGAYEKQGDLTVGGTEVRVPLRQGEVYCDTAFAKPSAARAYARLLLSRLALLEGRALRAFRQAAGNAVAEEEAYAALSAFRGNDAEEIAALHSTLRRLEARGAYTGEGLALARLYEAQGAPLAEWKAYVQLSALYAAFFKAGKPRRYFVPDYAARAKRAGVDYRSIRIPRAAEYALCAITLEKIRFRFTAELNSMQKKRAEEKRALSALGGKDCVSGGAELLKKLPESEGGLSAIIRDFGLVEE